MKEMARIQHASTLPRQIPPSIPSMPVYGYQSDPYGASAISQKRSPASTTRLPFRNNDWERGQLKGELEEIDSEICSLQAQIMRDLIS